MVSGKIHVGDDLVGIVDERTKEQLQATAQRLANAWPDEQTVLVMGKSKEIIKPRKGVVRVVYEAIMSEIRRPAATSPVRKPAPLQRCAR